MTHMTDSMINRMLIRGDYQPAQQTRGKTNNDTRQENDIQPRTGGFNKPTCMILSIIIIIIHEKFVVRKNSSHEKWQLFSREKTFCGFRATCESFFHEMVTFLPCNPWKFSPSKISRYTCTVTVDLIVQCTADRLTYSASIQYWIRWAPRQSPILLQSANQWRWFRPLSRGISWPDYDCLEVLKSL